MNPLLRQLAERKVGQWALAYVGAAWMILEFVNLIGQTWGLSPRVEQGLQIALLFGLPVTILLAWFHGEKGRQRVTGAELVTFAVVVAVGAFALSAWSTRPLPPGGAGADRLVVLPFETRRVDTTLAYVAEALRDAISDEIGAYEGIDVISRSSVIRSSARLASPSEIAAQLNADAFVEGSVSGIGGRVTVRIALTDVETERELLTRTFSFSEDQIPQGVADVAAAVAVAFHPQIGTAVADQRAAAPTVSREAWRAYARARSLLLQAEPDAHARARSFIDRAIGADSTWAAPYALLARWYVLSGFFGVEAAATAQAARRAANRALSLDRGSAQAYYALSQVQYTYDWDWFAADASLASALELAPQDSEVRVRAATIFSIWGRDAEALEHGLRAVDLDPLSCLALTQLSMVHTLAGRYAEAEARARECLDLDPDFSFTYYRLAWAQQGAGNFAGARQTVEDALVRFGAVFPDRWRLFAADIHAHSGGSERAQELLAGVLERGVPAGFGGSVVGIYAGLGDWDRAMEWFIRIVDDRSAPDPLYGLALARLGPLRQHPGYEHLLEALRPPASMGLVASQN